MGPQTDVPGKEGICHIQCDHKKFTVQTSIILRVLIIRASLIAQLVKNLPVMQETLVQFLVRKICWRRDKLPTPVFLGFPGGSAGIRSACHAGDPSSIPGSGSFPGEGTGYLFQYSWASLVAQLVKNLPAMWETWVPSLGWEDPLERGKATHSSILAWRIPCPGVTKSRTRLSVFHLTNLTN